MGVALVTGGRRGIGLAIVKQLRNAGYKVAVAAKSGDAPDCDLYLMADLSKVHDRFRLIDKVCDALGRLDVLVNNAADMYSASVREYAMTRWQAQLDLLLTAPFDLSQQAAKRMKSGHIVNILSTASMQASRNQAGYIAAKHGLLGLTRALSLEFAPDIRVNGVIPGFIETDMNKDIIGERKALLHSLTPAGRFGTAAEVAAAVMFLVHSTYIYGQTIVVDGGWMVKNG